MQKKIFFVRVEEGRWAAHAQRFYYLCMKTSRSSPESWEREDVSHPRGSGQYREGWNHHMHGIYRNTFRNYQIIQIKNTLILSS